MNRTVNPAYKTDPLFVVYGCPANNALTSSVAAEVISKALFNTTQLLLDPLLLAQGETPEFPTIGPLVYALKSSEKMTAAGAVIPVTPTAIRVKKIFLALCIRREMPC